MISRTFPWVISLLICASACADEGSVEPRNVEINFSQESETLLLVSAVISPSVAVENIRIRKDEHLDDWVLEFRSVASLKVLSADGASVDGAVYLDEDGYSRLIWSLLEDLSYEYSELSIGRIQTDIKFVDSTWHSVASRVRAETKDLAGEVEQKNLGITNAVVDTIANSAQVRTTCDALEANGISCSTPPVTANPVAFRPEVVGTPWTSLAELSDVGLRNDVWFTIRTN